MQVCVWGVFYQTVISSNEGNYINSLLISLLLRSWHSKCFGSNASDIWGGRNSMLLDYYMCHFLDFQFLK